jgi:hypothetical protein
LPEVPAHAVSCRTVITVTPDRQRVVIRHGRRRLLDHPSDHQIHDQPDHQLPIDLRKP